jgi:hypothetical protein
VRSQRNLSQVVRALRAPGRFTGGLDCGQQEGDKNSDDGDNHQQFDQGKRFSAAGFAWGHFRNRHSFMGDPEQTLLRLKIKWLPA